MAKEPRKPKIPGVDEWRGYKSDLDVRYLHSIFFGKSNDEVQSYFEGGHSISRMDELLFAPRQVFQYYVHGFAQYLASPNAREDCDAASSFLTLLEARERRDPGSVSNIFDSLVPTLRLVVNGQKYFDADIDIYGSFRERAADILESCGRRAELVDSD